MTNLGNKIKKIRENNGLTQESFAKKLGYNSKSTINKIEKGINEISYGKLMLLIREFDLEPNSLFDERINISFAPVSSESNLYISFSARSGGNSENIARYMMKDSDDYIAFKDIDYHSCSKCNYECFTSVCKYRNDDLFYLFDNSVSYKHIILLLPMYCNNPSSLYYIFLERMQDFFNHNEDKWESFISSLYIVAIYGSDEESPLFIKTLNSLIENDGHILKIERHKYKIGMNDRVIDNDDLKHKIDIFKEMLK